MTRSVSKTPLPTVAGVRPCSQRLPPGPWRTVLGFFSEQFPQVDGATWTIRMSKGEVVDETGDPLHPGSAYRVGTYVHYYREVKDEKVIPFSEQVLYRDDNILVVDKPHFLPIIPAGNFLHETLLVRLRKKFNLEDLTPVHRLDRETAGVVLFAVNAGTRSQYTALFRERQVRKVYEALAPALDQRELPAVRRSRIVRDEPFFRMKETEGEANAETHIKQLDKLESHSRYELVPITGKKHQLRVHMAALGIPIMNDKLYPEVTRAADDDFSAPMKLLAKSLSFKDPLTGQEHDFESRFKL